MGFKKIIIGLLFLFCFSTLSLSADALTREQRLVDAQTMLALFDNRYAPIQWKKDSLGVSLPQMSEELLHTVGGDISDQDFYAAMAGFSARLQDTHNWFYIPSSHTAELGFSVDAVEGAILIDRIDRKILPKGKFPYERGDELISIDAVRVEQIMAGLSSFRSDGNLLAKRRMLAKWITERIGKRLPFVPQGDVDVEIFSRDRKKRERITLQWQEKGKPYVEGGRPPFLLSKLQSILSLEGQFQEKEENKSPLENLRWSAVDATSKDTAGLGDPVPFFPLWNTFVQRTETPLFSGIFLMEGKRIGFLRIPTWAIKGDGRKEWFSFFEKEIPFLDRETDALLIDQTNNGGGNLCFAEKISGFFVTEPAPFHRFEVRATRSRLIEFESELKDCIQEGTPEDCRILEEIVFEMRRAVTAGDLLTKPISLCATDAVVYPHKTKEGAVTIYTKPIVMLVNEWSASAADMVPAFLQDSGRVVLFGGRTSGAGGNVVTIGPLGYSDFEISQTESLVVRPKEVTTPQGIQTHYIENVGVTPDVEYPITKGEFLHGYAGYRKAIETTLLSLIR